MSSLSKYEVLDTVRHNGDDYALGDEIELSDEHAASLLKVGAVAKPSAPTTPTKAELTVMTNDQLRELLDKEHMPTSGNKDELIERLLE